MPVSGAASCRELPRGGRRLPDNERIAWRRGPMHAGFNFEPLTPTAFLHRAAQVFPDRIGVVEGERQVHLRRIPRAIAQVRRRAEGAGRQARRPRRGPRRQFARDARGALRGAVRRRGARARSTRAITPADMAYILGPRRRVGADLRPGIRQPAAPRPARRSAPSCGWFAPAATATSSRR